MYDLVIRNGTVHDGLGLPPIAADIGIRDGRIAFVGHAAAPGHEEIDATGRIVTPGFVDLHSHYDAQAMWDPILAQSAWHGVTSVVMGNCGVGFAPARPSHRDWLAQVMENVEEIPTNVLAAGLPWNWESFPEYLDALDALPHVVDIGTHVPHIALRAYVMGERAERDEPANGDDIRQMAELVEQGIAAGGLGFSFTRTDLHRTSQGDRVPGSMAGRDEIEGIAQGVQRAGSGVIQLLSDLTPCEEEFDWLERLSRDAEAPVALFMVQSSFHDRDWRWQIERVGQVAAGARIYAHVAPRGNGVILSWRGGMHPFMERPSWKAIAALPWEQRRARVLDPTFRDRMLAEDNVVPPKPWSKNKQRMLSAFERQYEMGAVPEYEPDPETMSIAVMAGQAGKDAARHAYDILCHDEGQGLIYMPMMNYDDGNLDHARALLLDPNTVVSLGDGGAHATRVIDASTPSFLLSHWVRDRTRGDTIPLELAIKHLTSVPAASYQLNDRGVIAEGMLADINVIDVEELALERPYLAADLPDGGLRLLQKARGYAATIKRGVVTFRDGEHTGATPGRVIRGRQKAERP